ncbi:molybdopterin-dependent oxidoreductase [Jatrophihabitans sp. YIM 134969]
MSTSGSGAPTGGTPVGRRVFLGVLGFGALGVLIGHDVQGGLATGIAKLPDPGGILGLLPLGGGFRYYSVTGSVPVRTAADYRLTVDGLVDRPLTLSLDDLQDLPQTSMTRDFQCVTGWRVPSVPWKGVRVRDLLDRVGVQRSATALRFVSFDGTYTESLTLDQARRDDVIVATSMLDDTPVTHDHGGPVRLYVAPMYGYKSIKWLERIEVIAAVQPGYWEQYGYDVDGWVGESNGRSDEKT